MSRTGKVEETYDYVICGYSSFLKPGTQYTHITCSGGTAGCVIAGRLADDPAISILLIEAGGPRDSVPASAIPAAYLVPKFLIGRIALTILKALLKYLGLRPTGTSKVSLART